MNTEGTQKTTLRKQVNAALRVFGKADITDQQFAIVIDAHSQDTRDYHGIRHVAELAEVKPNELARITSDDNQQKRLAALITLGAFYHDVVYTQVDGGLTQGTQQILSKYVQHSNDHKYYKKAQIADNDQQVFNLVQQIFNSDLNKPLTNEFLSALVAFDQMRDMGFDEKTIAQVVAIIEGTIPFRKSDYFDELAKKLSKLALTDSNKFPPEEIETTVKAAVFLANKDVLAFAGKTGDLKERVENFLSNTWQLLPEQNTVLRRREYLPIEYRKIMQKDQHFCAEFLTGEGRAIFHDYKGFPPANQLSELKEWERKVRRVVNLYLKAKTVSAAIVEAMAAEAKGGEKHLSEIMGDLDTQATFRYLPDLQETSKAFTIAYHLLKEGRSLYSHFDNQKSAVAAYLCSHLRKDSIDGLFASVKKHLGGNSPDYKKFLKASKTIIGEEHIVAIAEGLAIVADKKNPAFAASLRSLPEKLGWAAALRRREESKGKQGRQ